MQAVVANVPDSHADQVRELWSQLSQRFGVHSELTEDFPHFSLHVAGGYEAPAILDQLAGFAQSHPPLRVRTAGLGLFTRTRTVLYMPLVRNPRLNDFHRDLWKSISGLGDDVFPYYRPERWIPHITLAHDRLDQYNLGGAMQWLSDQKLDWVFDVRSLSLLEASAEERREVRRFELSAADA